MNRVRIAALACLCATPNFAQPIAGVDETGEDPATSTRVEIARPRLAGRIVHHSDFEESRINPFPVPRYWRRAQGDRAAPDGSARDGFPLWNEAVLDYRTAAEGEGSVFLPASGGSTCLRLEPGVIPVLPGANYLISAKVRSRGLEHARARMSARFLDSANQAIRASESAGELLGDEPAWRPVTLVAHGDFADAAFLQVDLELLQPVQFQAPTLGKHQVWPEDFAGAAWFDEVTVTQLPRIELSTASPVNVTVAPDRPEVKAHVRDLTGETMRARLTLYDIDGKPADTDERDIGSGQAAWTWTPRVDTYGWYRVSLEVLTGGVPVADAALDLVWLPATDGAPTTSDRARFGVALDAVPDGRAGDTATLVRRSGAGAATIPIWSDALTAESSPKAADDLGPLMEPVLLDDTGLTFSLAPLPRVLAGETRGQPDDALSAFSLRESAWGAFLAPFVDRYGQSVRRWRVGLPPASAPRRLAEGRKEMRRLEHYLAALVPGPIVAVPWPANPGLDRGEIAGPGAPDAVDAIAAPSMTPDAIGEFVEDWHHPAPAGALSLVLETPAPSESSRRESVHDLLRRAVVAWAASDATGCAGVTASIRQPWTWTSEPGTQARAAPTPELAAWRCLGDRLAGRRFVASPTLAPGVRAMLFEPDGAGQGGGLLVAWREPSEPGSSVIDAFLGSEPIVAYDAFGNATPVEARAMSAGRGAPRESRSHSVAIADAPVFVEGVNTGLARFTASLRLEPSFVPSSSTRHDLEIVLSNPWREPISGRLLVLEPGRLSDGAAERDRTWRVSPRQVEFSIGAGDRVTLPITLTFGAMEEAGPKMLVADVDLEGRPEYGRLRLRAPFEIGLPDLGLDLSYRVAPGGPLGGDDVVVEAVVANHGSAPVTLELTAFAPPGNGFARSRATVSGLEPGESAVRRFPFTGGAARLRGQAILVGVQDTASGARLNRSVAIVEAMSDER